MPWFWISGKLSSCWIVGLQECAIYDVCILIRSNSDETIKWGATRLWNPNDFVNQRRKDPLALFDERTGVPLVKVHIPYETLNFYLIGLLGEASHLDEPGAAFRFEAAFGSAEIALSGIAGKGRKTAFGFDISTALGELDFTAEVSLSAERDTPASRRPACQ